MEYGSGFRFSTLRDGVKRNVLEKSDQFTDVRFIMSKLSTNTIQIVISDATGANSVTAGKAVLKEIQNGKNKSYMTFIHYMIALVLPMFSKVDMKFNEISEYNSNKSRSYCRVHEDNWQYCGTF